MSTPINVIRVGVIDFFGILCPGVLLFLNLLLLADALNRVVKIPLPFAIDKNNTFLFTVATLFIFVVCYLLGMVLRLLRPYLIDKTITVFYRLMDDLLSKEKRRIRKEGNEGVGTCADENFPNNDYYKKLLDEKNVKFPKFFWREELFPYSYGNAKFYVRNIPKQRSNLDIILQIKNTHIFNACKIWLCSVDPALAMMLLREEAQVRFVSGSFWALAIGLLTSMFSLITSIIMQPDRIPYSISLMILFLILIVIIVLNFKRLRRKEVKTLLDSLLIAGSQHPTNPFVFTK